jgi:hypothetical protein
MGMRRQYTQVINQAICSWYNAWNRDPHKRHMSDYYIMRSKRLLWLNGIAMDQEEVWEPEVTVMQIGVEGVLDVFFPGWERVLSCAIEYVRGKASEY